jgi:hypothetical protein
VVAVISSQAVVVSDGTMGTKFSAECKSCGFRSEDLYAGFGFQGAGDHYMWPAICPKCQSFGMKDQRHPPQHCRRCRAEMVFYGSADFSQNYYPDRLKAEPVGEDVSTNIREGKHVCPSCGKVGLTFKEIGDWA